jgi:hypothetical protein
LLVHAGPAVAWVHGAHGSRVQLVVDDWGPEVCLLGDREVVHDGLGIDGAEKSRRRVVWVESESVDEMVKKVDASWGF